MQGEPEICRDFRKGVCFRVNCRYAHINADGTPGTPNDQPVCRDFENGRCFRSNCRFFHRSAPELMAANLANSKRQGEPSPHELLDRFGPLGMNHPDYAAYPFSGGDLSPSGEFSRDARAIVAREIAKRELAISNRMLELSLAERALLELSIRERRQALGRLEPGPFQGLGRRDSVPVPGFNDLVGQMGARPSPTLPSSLNRTRSVPVQGFQDLRGIPQQRHAEVIAPPRLDRRGSVPSQGMDLDGEQGEGFRDGGGGFGWQTPGANEREYPPAMGNPPLGRSTSETVQHLQEMRRAADSLLLDLERARRKESLSVPGSPELVGGERPPRLDLDPRVLNRVVGSRGPVSTPEEGPRPEGPPFQGLERYGSLRSAPEVLCPTPPLQKYASEPPGRGQGGNQQEAPDRKTSPQSLEQGDPRRSPEPVSDEGEGRAFKGVQEDGDSISEQDMRGEGGLLSPEDGDFNRKSKSLQASPETRPASQGFPGFGRGGNGLTSQGLQGLNLNITGGGMLSQRAGSNGPPPEGLLRSQGSINHNQGAPEGLVRSLGSINHNEGLVRSMGGINPNPLGMNHTQGLARTNSGPFGSDFSGDPLRAPLSRRTSSTPTGFLGRDEGPTPPAGASSLFTQYRDAGPWLSPDDQKEMFRHEQSKLFEDRAALERAMRAQQLGRQMSGGFEGGAGGDPPEMAGRFAQAGHFRQEPAGPYNQNPLEYARFPSVQQQQQQRQHAPQAQPQQHPSARPQYTETAPGPPTPPANETVTPSPKDFQEYSPFGSQPSLFKENSGKSIW